MSEHPTDTIAEIVDLDALPLHETDSAAYRELVARCRREWEADGMFNLVGLMRRDAIDAAVAQLRPLIDEHSFLHRRRHNIWFQRSVEGLDADHPALQELETSNRTVCADQMTGSPVLALYEWPALRAFVAEVIGAPRLHLMADELASVNVMSYRAGEALNWHFDRSAFTTTVLLQQPAAGGTFEYRPALRRDDDPNYDGVAALVTGQDPDVKTQRVDPGTVTVFAGHDTAHRVTATEGGHDRIIAVFSYYEQPGVRFSAEERLGFYGRA